jgi:hypothetical protein
MDGKEGCKVGLTVWPLGIEVVGWELPTVLGRLGLNGTVARQSSKIGVCPSVVEGGAGSVD